MQHIIQLAFKKNIRKGEYQFSFALNGQAALAEIEKSPEINLVLTDINMPEMDGLTLLRELRSRNELIRSVVVSAYGDMANIRTAMNHGAYDFLTKPIDLKDLKITVRRTLEEISLIRRALNARDSFIAIKKELDIARQLQLSMMPSLPAIVGPFQIAGQVQLSSDVGGDFWDLIQLNEEESLLVLGDCSGHGLSSALIMSAIRHSLLTLVMQTRDYRDIIPFLNQIVYGEFKSKASYATMVFVHFRKDSPEIRILRAGHELPIRLKQGEMQEPDWRGGLPIGIFPKRFKDEWVTMTLEPGEELFLYTDGIVDGLPNQQPAIEELIPSIDNLDEKIANLRFFEALKEDRDWQNLDDATLLKISLR